jgi:glycosyltransferase involved in cell wall biosynthesis
MKKIAVIYTHFPHYRSAVFDSLSMSKDYDFTFFYDPGGINATIAGGVSRQAHHTLKVRRVGPFFWQAGSIGLAGKSAFDGFIFLGNPLILSTWIAVVLARLRGKKTFLWTHGWLRRETGAKRTVRRAFYRLADGLMVYGTRARQIGISDGFAADRIHVVFNSLDYAAQKRARDNALAALHLKEAAGKDLPEIPFFLSVSRLVRGVGLDLAIEALAALPGDVALVLVGDGPERGRLEEQARALAVDVRFFGAVYDEERLAALFVSTRAVVSPGKVGLLAMHALAYGAPVITHDDLDWQMPEVEAIEPGVTGAFFRRGDVTDLAQAMTRFLEIPAEGSQREACRTAAIARIESEFTPEAQVARITAALDVGFEVKR